MRTCGDSHEVAPLFKVSQLRAKPPNTKADLKQSAIEYMIMLLMISGCHESPLNIWRISSRR